MLTQQRSAGLLSDAMATFAQHAYEKLFTPHQASPYVVKGIVDLTQPSLWIAVASMYV